MTPAEFAAASRSSYHWLQSHKDRAALRLADARQQLIEAIESKDGMAIVAARVQLRDAMAVCNEWLVTV